MTQPPRLYRARIYGRYVEAAAADVDEGDRHERAGDQQRQPPPRIRTEDRPEEQTSTPSRQPSNSLRIGPGGAKTSAPLQRPQW